MKVVVLKKNEENRLKNGFCWVFANEVKTVSGEGANGSVARVETSDGRFVAQGFLNHLSKILVRVLSFDEKEIDDCFYEKKIVAANEMRRKLGFDNCYRAFFAESDGIPGLIVDKYADVLSVQFLSLGVERKKDVIVDALKKVFSPVGIYERSDVKSREKEGLAESKGLLFGEVADEVVIEENGVKMIVDVKNGQKTGYFLDQKENRAALKRYCKDADVLDCFCNVGGFSMCALSAGAKSTTAVDVSSQALDFVKRNAALNGFQVDTLCRDVFEVLRDCKKDGKTFSVVVLDPPAFAKTADAVENALKGYADINTLGMKLVRDGGYLVSCSCSQHVSVAQFLAMLQRSARESGKTARLLELKIQSPDHAATLTMDESIYLKAAFLQITSRA